MRKNGPSAQAVVRAGKETPPGLSREDRFRHRTIDEIRNNIGSEANSYPAIKSLFCDARCEIGLGTDRVLIDTRLSSGVRPDVQVWLDVPRDVRTESDHLLAVVEVKPGETLAAAGDAIAKDKYILYSTPGLRYFYLFDAVSVRRYDIDISRPTLLPKPTIWTWLSLKEHEEYVRCFEPIHPDRASLERDLAAFKADGSSVKRRDVTDVDRTDFVDAIIAVARILTRAVREAVEEHLRPSLVIAKSILAEYESKYGKVSFDWLRPDEPITFEGLSGLSGPELAQFHDDYVFMLDELRPFRSALRAEFDVLQTYAARSGLSANVSLGGTDKDSMRAREAFIQESAALVLSRLLMIRFSEDHMLLERYISNGGISAFSHYAAHFAKPYQRLVRDAYENARPVYHHLFADSALDWIIDGDSQQFSGHLVHAMWIMAKWNFATVRGDILSGVYDRYLEPKQRKLLGEVYTRPEIARYILESAGYSADCRILDPACGTGTFLVEAFESVRQASEQANVGLDVSDVYSVLPRLNGLDINGFSATIAKIQLLWHVLICIRDGDISQIRDAIKALRVEGGHSSLDTWGRPMSKGVGIELGLHVPRKSKREERDAGSFKNISSDEGSYDIVVGNPPFVRIERVEINPVTAREYDEIVHKKTDFSELFVYRALKWWLKDGGRCALILPFSVLESGGAERLRTFLENYRLIEIIDLELVGQVLFQGVAIVACVLIVEKNAASADDQVVVTTVTSDCIDERSRRIDMEKAIRTTMRRSEITQKAYLPNSGDQFGDELDDDEQEEYSTNALLTKVKPDDVALLRRLAALPRLENLIQCGYRNKKDRARRQLQKPSTGLENWTKRPLSGKGVEIGSRTAPSSGLPIFKGANTFPDGVVGAPFAYWNGDPSLVKGPRFYAWGNCVRADRCFGFREISVVPFAAPHPENAYFHNTLHVVQLNEEFPLNVYLLSSIPQWFALKTARMTVLFARRAHWYTASIFRTPIPPDRSDARLELRALGEAIAELDRELSAGVTALENLAAPAADKATVGAVAQRGGVQFPGQDDWIDADASAEELAVVETPNEVIIESADLALFAPTRSGRPCAISFKDPLLRRWVAAMGRQCLLNDKVPTKSWLKNLGVPRDLNSAVELIDRIESGTAKVELENRLSDLDRLVAGWCGLSDRDLEYIRSEMRVDPFLRGVAPTWQHTAPRRFRGYSAFAESHTYN